MFPQYMPLPVACGTFQTLCLKQPWLFSFILAAYGCQLVRGYLAAAI